MRPQFFLLLIFCMAFASADMQYGCMIDAGSTGSRIYVYRWNARSFPQLPPPVTTPIEVVAYVLDPVQTRVDTPEGRAALPQLLDKARSKLAELGLSSADISAIPLFLKATAGMRILTEEARATAMAAVRAILSRGPFLFKSNWARTISGEEEGVAGWIAVNYNAGLLPGQKSDSGGATIGALDLGGASTQITFVPPPGVDILSSQFDVRLTNAAQVSVYTHSFLYYGATEAIRRINELVVLSAGPAAADTTIPHPCYLAGTPGGVNFTSLIAGRPVNFSGSSNWTACKEFVTPLMLRGAQCLTDPKPSSWPQATALGGVTAADWAALQAQRQLGVAPLPVINPGASGSSCSLAGQYQPPLVSPLDGGGQPLRFMAFSGYSYLYEGLRLGYTAPLSELRSACTTFCNLDFATAQAAYPADRYFTDLCMRCVYAQTLLVEGYGLNTTVPGIVTVVPATPGVSWTLGSILYEANSLPFSLIAARDQTATVIALAVTLGVVLLAGSVLGFFLWRRWPKDTSMQRSLL
jgi:hypothetical protein